MPSTGTRARYSARRTEVARTEVAGKERQFNEAPAVLGPSRQMLGGAYGVSGTNPL